MQTKNGKPASTPTGIPILDETSAVGQTDLNVHPGFEGLRLLGFAALTCVLFALCVTLALPFLSALAWGVALTIVAWPLQCWVRRYIAAPSGAAAVTTIVVLTLVVVPGLLITYQLAREAQSVAGHFKGDELERVLREQTTNIPALNGVANWLERGQVNLDAEISKQLSAFFINASRLLQGSLVAIIQFVIAMFILFHFLKDGPAMRARVAKLLPLSKAECDRVFASAAGSMRANIHAAATTSLIDGVTGGLLFWALDLPAPVLWGVVIFAISILPVFGTILVWLPASLLLILNNRWPESLLLIGWGVTTAILVDNLLFVRLSGMRMRLHPVPTLLAFLGGIVVFGPSGIILGPAILAVTVAVFEVWHRRDESDQASDTLADARHAAAGAGLLTDPQRFENALKDQAQAK